MCTLQPTTTQSPPRVSMGRSPCCDEHGLKKGPWTPEEDQKLVQYIQKHGHGSWRAIPKLAGLNRCGKSCRLRWTNYLRPDIKRGNFSPEEEQTILNLHSILGNKWSAIAMHLPGRTDNEIKNLWHTHLKKKLIQMGFDPMTHRPRTDFFTALPQLLALLQLHQLMNSHPQDDDHAARLQVLEAIQAAKLQYFQCLLQSVSATSNNSYNCSDLETISLLSSQMTSSFPSHNPPQNIDSSNQLASFFEPPESNDTKQCSNFSGFNQGENNKPRTPFASPLPPLTDVSVANQGDGCSITSCDGNGTPFCWPEIMLDDQFMSEFV
ncbi:unnamed protein product [Musa acuminata subsp. burmannicoides]